MKNLWKKDILDERRQTLRSEEFPLLPSQRRANPRKQKVSNADGLEIGKYLIKCFTEIMKDLEELDKEFGLENIGWNIKKTKEMVKILFD